MVDLFCYFVLSVDGILSTMLRVLFVIFVVLFIIVPQDEKAATICNKFPNLSVYFLYSGWCPYFILPLYLVNLLLHNINNSLLSMIVMLYVVYCAVLFCLSYGIATFVIAKSFFKRRIMREKSL